MSFFPAAGKGVPPLYVLMIVGSTSQISTTLYLASLPSIAADFNVSLSVVQYTITVYTMAFASSQLVLGAVADRYGRRPVLLIGLALYALCSLLCAVAPGIEWLLPVRIVQAVGACAGLVMARAIIRDTRTTDSARAMAWLSMALSAGPAFAPTLGGQIELLAGWRANFALLCAITTVALVLCFFLVGETGRPSVLTRGLFRGYVAVLRSGRFMAFATSSGLTAGAFYMFLTASPAVYMGLLEMPVALYGFVPTFWGLASIIGSWVATRTSKRFDGESIGLAGMAVTACSFVAMAGFSAAGMENVATLTIPLFIGGLGTGISLPNAANQALFSLPATVAGSGSAMVGFLQMGWATVGSFIMASVLHASSLPMTAGMAVAALLAVVCYVFGMKQRTTTT